VKKHLSKKIFGAKSNENPIRRKGVFMSSWAKTHSKIFLLPLPVHNQNRLPVPYRGGKMLLKATKDTQIVQEFRSKLRRAEELISKLAFNLREIQGLRRKNRVKSTAGR
jgi:hypothetical protein